MHKISRGCFLVLALNACHVHAQQTNPGVSPVIPEEVRKALEQARLRALKTPQPRPIPRFTSPPPTIIPINPAGVAGISSESPSTLSETLAQAAVDLKSPKEELRLSAAKLLGKYHTVQAGTLLVSVLGDSSIKVRRAAVRSLLENRAFHGRADAEKLMAMLGDEDVEVRREISKAIPILRSRLSLSTTVTRIINGRPITTSVPYRLTPQMAQVVTNASGVRQITNSKDPIAGFNVQINNE